MLVKKNDKVYRVDEMLIVTREALEANVSKARELLTYAEKQLAEYDAVVSLTPETSTVAEQPAPQEPTQIEPVTEQPTTLQPVETAPAPVEQPTLTVEPTLTIQ